MFPHVWILLHQRCKPQRLFERIHTGFAVDISVVESQRTFFDAGRLDDSFSAMLPEVRPGGQEQCDTDENGDR